LYEPKNRSLTEQAAAGRRAAGMADGWRGPQTGTGVYAESFLPSGGPERRYIRVVCKCGRGGKEKIALKKLAAYPVLEQRGALVIHV
jgi:hypothetical protein